MAKYYPKSQIITNLYTNGGEFILATTKENYEGKYYRVSNGNSYTGESPYEGENILLIPKTSLPFTQHEILPKNFIKISTLVNPNSPLETNYKQVEEYESVSGFKVGKRYVPLPSPTIPTKTDYNNGQFTRYFTKKTNEMVYFEINQKTFTDLVNKSPSIAYDLYLPIVLGWKLTGNKEQVFNTNKLSISIIERNQNLYGFSSIFKNNFSKYYLES